MKIQVLYNANIIDLSDKNRKDSVLVLIDDRIAARGDNTLLDQFGRDAVKQDMQGACLLPGFTDAHIHLYNYAFGLEMINVETRTKEEAVELVKKACETLKEGQWLIGIGWQHNEWGGKLPSRNDLDPVSPKNPVYLMGKSLHVGWVNSLGLKAAGVSTETPDPLNGRIVRDEHGLATGILLENAMQVIQNAIPEKTLDQARKALVKAFTELHKFGITSVHDFDYRSAFQAYQTMDLDNELRLRIVKSIPVEMLDYAAGLGLRSGFGSKNLKIGSVKLFMDGALGPRTAAMIQPYEGEPNNLGFLNLDVETLIEIGKKAIRSGLAITAHAIGDMANHVLLDGFESLNGTALDEGLGLFRHRIEHVQLLHPNDLNRLAELGIIASMQPIHAISDMDFADKYWAKRARFSYAWRTQLNAGAPLVFGSDAPVESPNPFWGLYASITRKKLNQPNSTSWYAEETLNLRESLLAYTEMASFAGYNEKNLGKLEPGFLADLIVLDKDPFELDPEALRDTLPQRVMFGGEWVI